MIRSLGFITSRGIEGGFLINRILYYKHTDLLYRRELTLLSLYYLVNYRE